MRTRRIRNLLPVVFIPLLLLTTASRCDKEDEPKPAIGCESFQSKADELFASIDGVGYDCDKLKAFLAGMQALLEKSKGCLEAKQLASEKGHDSVEAYIAALKATTLDCPG